MGLSLQELVPGMKVSSWVGLHLHLDIHCLRFLPLKSGHQKYILR